ESSSRRKVEAVVDSATKICGSARSMLHAVLLSVLALTDALASAGKAATPSTTRQGEAAAAALLDGGGRQEIVSEAWSAVAFRA
ncbi:unnamed protein product, partial [Ectocarpus sp. 12 AP-2014]